MSESNHALTAERPAVIPLKLTAPPHAESSEPANESGRIARWWRAAATRYARAEALTQVVVAAGIGLTAGIVGNLVVAAVSPRRGNRR
jgi:hypothetical protein